MRFSRIQEILSHPNRLPDLTLRRFGHGMYQLGRFYRAVYRNLHTMPAVSVEMIAPNTDRRFDVIMDEICLPPHFLVDSHDDLTPLLRIAQHSRPRFVFEFGTAFGNTVANICRICDAHVFTVNALPEQISGKLSTYTLSKDQIGSVYRRHGFSDRVTQIYANTLNFDPLDWVKTACIDLAIIDACHDTAYVLNDFAKILPALSETAIVLFHDTHPSMANHLAGSYRACAKLRRRGFDIKHVDGTWWGVWTRHTPERGAVTARAAHGA